MKLGLISDIHGDPVALELAWSLPHCDGSRPDRLRRRPGRVRPVSRPGRRVPSGAGDCLGPRQPRPLGPGARARRAGRVRRRAARQRDARLPGDAGLSTWSWPRIRSSASSSTARPAPTWSSSTARAIPRRSCATISMELDCDLLVVGHTHRPMWFRCPDGLVVNPGSVVSMPGVDSSRTFAMVDLDTLEVTFHDVESGGAVEVAMWQ